MKFTINSHNIRRPYNGHENDPCHPAYREISSLS
jgi:hypothetical protein